MANQKAIIKLLGRRKGPQDLRCTLVDSDGGAVTFTDVGSGDALWIADDDYKILDVTGQGTTAPTTATAFQISIDRNQTQMFLNGAAIYDPTSSAQARVGAALGYAIMKGTNVAITGRA